MALLVIPIAALGSFGLIFATLYGCRVREGLIENPDRFILHKQMVALGCVIAVVCWMVVWWMYGLLPMILQYWWVGIFPFTITYGFEVVADNKLDWATFWWWFGFSAFLSCPGLGQVCTVLIGAFNLAHVLYKEDRSTPIAIGMDVPQ